MVLDSVVVVEEVNIHKAVDGDVVAHIPTEDHIVIPMVIATTLEQIATLRDRIIRPLQLFQT